MSLYYDLISPPSRTVLAVARHAKVDIEVINTPLMEQKNRSEEFLKINPTGKVPTYKDGDLVLFESVAIARYLLDVKAGGHSLYPSGLKTRALVD